jgi:glycosyltransferase involved in cell wall biosynthesis
MNKKLYVILTTYNRQKEMMRTAESFLDRVQYAEEIKWLVSDDGSPDGYLDSLLRILPSDTLVYDSQRKGVGHGMNWGIEQVKSKKGQLIITLEDDWEAVDDFCLDPYADLLFNHTDIGMVRFGYMSPGVAGTVISRDNKLWWKLEANGYQYRYTGHPALKHIRFYQEYAMYIERRSPGQTELHMCGIVNSKPDGPAIVIPVYFQAQWGLFAHIGSESLADVDPE